MGGVHRTPGVRIPEQMEPGHELLVEHGNLAIEDDNVRTQLGDRGGPAREIGGCVRWRCG